MVKVLISAGHNPGTDPGAIGQGQQEANDNVRMCDRIVHYLRTWGISTDYMPNDVGDLQAEINWANKYYSDDDNSYAIQIHRNAGGGTGNEVWTTAYKNQIPLATSILNAMASITGLPSRGVKDIKNGNPLGWINYVKAQSVLVEARFIDRDSITDADDMVDAYAIACGIADFLKVPRGKSVEQIEQDNINARNAAIAAENAAKAKAEQERIAAEKAKAEAIKASEAQKAAEEIARQKALELANIEKAQADINNENLKIIDIILRAFKSILNAILGKKG